MSLLQQLSDETQRVYGKARLGMVRVQLPTPQWLDQINQQINKEEELLRKWGDRLDPAVRQQIIDQMERQIQQVRTRQGTVPASQPAGLSIAMIAATRASNPATRPAGKDQGSDAHHPEPGNLILVATGLLVDDDGHAAFPVFVDRRDVGDSILPALTGDGRPTTAKFIGSDRLTNLTVLQLAKPSGQPIALGHSRPDDGVLTLVIAGDSGARLVVWNNMHPEPGLAVLPDGSVAGFGFDGHFLSASTAKPIVDQLIVHHEIRRAVLGVVIQELQKDDPTRQTRENLGNKPAIHVMAVDPESVAFHAGMRADDLILAVDGEIVGDAPTFAAVIATHSGSTVLRVLRGDREVAVTVMLKPD